MHCGAEVLRQNVKEVEESEALAVQREDRDEVDRQDPAASVASVRHREDRPQLCVRDGRAAVAAVGEGVEEGGALGVGVGGATVERWGPVSLREVCNGKDCMV